MTVRRKLDDCMYTTLLFGAALWLVLFITMQIFRFRHAGKVCSGDYQPDPWSFYRDPNPPYMFEQGQFIWWSIIS